MRWKTLVDFAFMRFVLPLGWGADKRWRRTSRVPGLAPLAEEGLMVLTPIERTQLSAIKTFLAEVISSKTEGKFNSVEAFSKSLIAKGHQREILHFSTGSKYCPIAELSRSEPLMSLACDFLGLSADEVVIEAMVDLLLPVRRETGAYDALQFHRDLDAYRFLKIFIYLEDCLEGEGHHEYLARTHRYFPVRVCSLRGYDSEEIISAIPSAKLTRVYGTAGFAFAENTLGFHRATLPTRQSRLMATLIYTESRFRDLCRLHFRP